jgi:hypothetical protein
VSGSAADLARLGMFAWRKTATIASNFETRSPSHRRTAFTASASSRLSTRSARQSEHCLNSARYSALQIGQYRILAFRLSADSSIGKLTLIVRRCPCSKTTYRTAKRRGDSLGIGRGPLDRDLCGLYRHVLSQRSRRDYKSQRSNLLFRIERI